MYSDPRYDNVLQRPASIVAWNPFQLVEHLEAVDHGSENCVLAIKMVVWPVRNEELARVRVLATVRHGQHPALAMFECRNDLILEFAPVYAHPPFPGALGVAALNHKPLYISVELGIIVDARSSQPKKVTTCRRVEDGECTSEYVIQSVSRSVSQSVGQPVDQPASQPASQPVGAYGELLDESVCGRNGQVRGVSSQFSSTLISP